MDLTLVRKAQLRLGWKKKVLILFPKITFLYSSIGIFISECSISTLPFSSDLMM